MSHPNSTVTPIASETERRNRAMPLVKQMDTKTADTCTFDDLNKPSSLTQRPFARTLRDAMQQLQQKETVSPPPQGIAAYVDADALQQRANDAVPHPAPAIRVGDSVRVQTSNRHIPFFGKVKHVLCTGYVIVEQSGITYRARPSVVTLVEGQTHGNNYR